MADNRPDIASKWVGRVAKEKEGRRGAISPRGWAKIRVSRRGRSDSEGAGSPSGWKKGESEPQRGQALQERRKGERVCQNKGVMVIFLEETLPRKRRDGMRICKEKKTIKTEEYRKNH